MDWSSENIVKESVKHQWIIYKFLQGSGVGWLYGSPGSMKSFLAIDIACHVASGKEWCGRAVTQGPVLYFAAEGGIDLHVRRLVWEKQYGKAEKLKIIAERPEIDHERYYSEDCKYVRRGYNHVRNHVQRAEEECGEKPILIILDTFAQTCSDDSKAAVSRYIKNLNDVLKDFAPKASFLVIDHTTKEGTTWMGSQAKMGDVDLMAKVSEKSGEVCLSMSGGKGKIKAASPFENILFKAKTGGCGIDDMAGQEITSLFLESCDDKKEPDYVLVLREILQRVDGDTEKAREIFKDHKINVDAQPGTVRQRFLRGMKSV